MNPEYEFLVELNGEIGQAISYEWGSFITVHLALFTVFLFLHAIKKYQILLFIPAYMSFSLMNMRAKTVDYQSFNASLKDIQDLCESMSTNLCNTQVSLSFADRIPVTYFVHALAVLGVCILCYKAWFYRCDSTMN